MELKNEIITEFTQKELYPVVYITRVVCTSYNYSATSTYVRNTRFVIVEEILRDPYERSAPRSVPQEICCCSRSRREQYTTTTATTTATTINTTTCNDGAQASEVKRRVFTHTEKRIFMEGHEGTKQY